MRKRFTSLRPLQVLTLSSESLPSLWGQPNFKFLSPPLPWTHPCVESPAHVHVHVAITARRSRVRSRHTRVCACRALARHRAHAPVWRERVSHHHRSAATLAASAQPHTLSRTPVAALAVIPLSALSLESRLRARLEREVRSLRCARSPPAPYTPSSSRPRLLSGVLQGTKREHNCPRPTVRRRARPLCLATAPSS